MEDVACGDVETAPTKSSIAYSKYRSCRRPEILRSVAQEQKQESPERNAIRCRFGGHLAGLAGEADDVGRDIQIEKHAVDDLQRARLAVLAVATPGERAAAAFDRS